MTMDEHIEDRIEAYLAGQMDPQARSAFEVQLAADPNLQAEVDLHGKLMGAIETEMLRRELRLIHVAQVNEADTGGRRIAFRPGWKTLAVAASVALLVGLGWLLTPRQPSDEALFAAHFSPAPGLPTTLGLSDSPQFDEGMISYKLGAYAASRTTWQPLIEQQPNNDTLRFFFGASYLAENQTTAAIDYLEPLIGKSGSAWQASAQWYTALAHLRNGEKAKARPLLESLSAVPGDYQERASRLLAEW